MEELTHDPAPRLDKLAAALAKAQGEMQPAPKSGKNPLLHNEYATLDDIIGAVRKPLANHGLSFVQLLENEGDVLTLRTVLIHESGQTLESTAIIGKAPVNRGVNELQALGSGITYMKRYALAAMLGVATGGDTDGEGADKKPTKQHPQKEAAPQKPAPTQKVTPADTMDDSPTISKPGELYEAIKPLEYYHSIPHMLNTLRKLHNDDKLAWASDDPKFYTDALYELTEYANANKAQEVIEGVAEQAAF